jgi:uncharacterized UPF0160 family protein
MTKDEALRLALEALEDETNEKYCPAITAIKAALKAKDEPWEQFCDSNCVWTDHHPDCKLANDEPVAWMVYTQEGRSAFVTDNPAVIHPSQRALPLYTTPQRTWVGLTDEEIEVIEVLRAPPVHPDFVDCDDWVEFARAIEAKLKEKNT